METPSVPLASVDRVVAGLVSLEKKGRPLVLASDLDGTLAPIAQHRDDTRVDAAALEALGLLSRCPGIIPCIASGRPLVDLRRLLAGVDGCVLIAEHGAVTAYPDGTVERVAVAQEQAVAMARVTPSVERFVAGLPGAEVERKETSFAVHIRGVAPELAGRAAQGLEALASEVAAHGLESISGRAVLEVRPALLNKGQALAQLLERVAPAGTLAFAGDDTTDEPGIVLGVKRGLGVFVISQERPTPPTIPGMWVVQRSTWVESLLAFARRGSGWQG